MARCLLLLFLLMQGVAALHTHETHVVEPICQECVHHLPHPGHLVGGPSHFDDCVICQLLAAPYLLPAPTLWAEVTDIQPLQAFYALVCVPSHEWMAPPLRAPPASLS